MNLKTEELAKMVGCAKRTIIQYLCRSEFAHVFKKRDEHKRIILCNIKPSDVLIMQSFYQRRCKYNGLDKKRRNKYV